MPIPITMIRDACKAIRDGQDCHQCPKGQPCRVRAEGACKAVLWELTLSHNSGTLDGRSRQGKRRRAQGLHAKSLTNFERMLDLKGD